MKTYIDCMPCFFRQAIDAIRLTGADEQTQHELIMKVNEYISQQDFKLPPPVITRKIYQLVREMSGNQDPFYEIKKKFNTVAMEMYPYLSKLIKNSSDPLETALRLAIAGNIIDFGVNVNFAQSQIPETIDHALSASIDPRVFDSFKAAIGDSQKILYLGDNAGEIVFDKLFIEQLPAEKITFCVRGGPIINDALLADAAAVGMEELVPVIDNGDCSPGTILQDCSEQFRKHYQQSDLIISKGQGNFETLNEITDKNIFFILKAKCNVVARHLNCRLGDLVFRNSKLC